MSDPARQLRDALRRLLVAHAVFEEARRPCGTPLSAPHAHALLELSLHGSMTISELAERLSIDRTNVSRLCARMEDAGELVRTPNPRDARARDLALTQQGRELAESVDRASAAHFETIIATVDDCPSVLRSLATLTRALATARDKPRRDSC